jgi:hypothetical protein
VTKGLTDIPEDAVNVFRDEVSKAHARHAARPAPQTHSAVPVNRKIGEFISEAS